MRRNAWILEVVALPHLSEEGSEYPCLSHAQATALEGRRLTVDLQLLGKADMLNGPAGKGYLLWGHGSSGRKPESQGLRPCNDIYLQDNFLPANVQPGRFPPPLAGPPPSCPALGPQSSGLSGREAATWTFILSGYNVLWMQKKRTIHSRRGN